MIPHSVKLGYWATWVCLSTFVIWIICFVAIFQLNPLFTWTNISDFIAYSNSYNQSFKYLAQFAMLLFAPAFLIIVNCIHDYAPVDKKIFSRISIGFATIFAVCIGIHYFVQISSVRLSIVKAQLEGLEQFIQANPTSGIAGINIVGWTLFFSLACLFAAPVFSGQGVNRLIRYALIANGIICILGGIGFVFDNIALIFITLNFGMGGAVLIAMTGLHVFFRRLQKTSSLITPSHSSTKSAPKARAGV
jgi:hypothetical protein